MSAHMKTHLTKENVCKVTVKMPGKKNIYASLPITAFPKLESLFSQYSKDEDSAHWTVVAKDDIKKHGQAGIVLRGARYRENMSQKKLAEKSGISQENISRIENGKRSIGEKVAKKLAKPLKISYKLLLEDYITP